MQGTQADGSSFGGKKGQESRLQRVVLCVASEEVEMRLSKSFPVADRLEQSCEEWGPRTPLCTSPCLLRAGSWEADGGAFLFHLLIPIHDSLRCHCSCRQPPPETLWEDERDETPG